ncbi:MAG TPA: 5'-3' exonuclease H3TH domain-containing protein, partial [Verrucomicrobiae bacterium]|nr:5'-3' exonuclease H3TH domain-containing protein [Verrucomicrobiae bacterium]
AEFDRVKARLRADGLLLWQADGYEADDLIAQATEAALHAGHHVRIASGDKDFLQLLGPDVDYLSLRTFDVVGPEKVREKYGVDVAQFGDYLALVGDKSDNVPGCPGCGPVNAAKLLNRCKDLADLAVELDRDAASVTTPKMAQALRENWAQIELARKLVDFRTDAPIRFEDIYDERQQQPLTEGPIDMDEPDDFETTPEPVSTKVEQLGSEEPTPTHAPIAVDDRAPVVETQAIAVAPTVEFSRGLEPISIGGAYKLARGLFESRLYQRFNNAEAIMAVIIRGREMGLGALTSLDAFHVIEGKPAPHAYLIIARAKADPDCEYFQCVESTATSCTWETKNRCNPSVTRLTYTIDDAKKAGILKPGGNWEKRPGEMCRARAGTGLARMEYPAAACGLYSWEELTND